jgi:hypothetical protein
MALVIIALVFVTVRPAVTQKRIQDILHQVQDGFLVVSVNTYTFPDLNILFGITYKVDVFLQVKYYLLTKGSVKWC